MGKRCKAKTKTKTGRRCKAFVVEGSEYCWSHDPGLARKRVCALGDCKELAYVSRSGKSRSKYCRPHLEERKNMRKWFEWKTAKTRQCDHDLLTGEY